jgi:drug/metabolite transporter (DMT)-like permease
LPPLARRRRQQLAPGDRGRAAGLRLLRGVVRVRPPLVLSSGQMIAGAVLLTLLAPVVARESVALTTSVVTSVLILGVLGTGIAYVLNYRLIADEGATAASTVTYLLPIVAVLLGLVILAEPASWNLAVGGAVVLAGVALSEGRIGGRRKRQVSRQEADLERARPNSEVVSRLSHGLRC